MQQQQSYETLLQISRRINWRVDDIIGGDRQLDFSKAFLPETFARTELLPFLTANERLLLNHIRAHGYLATFELVEQFIEPFIEAQSAASVNGDAFRKPALEQFAKEEIKHMELFCRFKREFADGFGTECALIGPAEAITSNVLAHGELALTIFVLALEWMSQGHYLESVKDDQELDSQFKNLLRYHWMEECQHARLDQLLLQTMAAKASPEDIDRAMDEFFEIGGFFDAGFKQQAELDLATFETAAGRVLPENDRATFLEVQHQALRWTYLGTALANRNFLAALESFSPKARHRVEEAAPVFC
jgi:hypothetical protein